MSQARGRGRRGRQVARRAVLRGLGPGWPGLPFRRGLFRFERGSASIYVLALLGVVWSAGLVTLTAGQALAVRHRAGTAADLAALAAADRVLEGKPAACAHADAVARANGAWLAACEVRGDVVDLSVEVRLRAGLGHLPPVRARARARPTNGSKGESPRPADLS